jgi:hypothetical protein
MSGSVAAPQGLMLILDWNTLPPSVKQALLDALATNIASEQKAAVGSAVAPPAHESNEGEVWSYPFTVPQARQLIEGIDEKTRNLLRRIAGQIDEDGYGWVSWPEAKELTLTTGWAHFAKGPLSGLHRRLRNIVQDSDAELLISSDDGWSGPDESGWNEATLFVDGQALRSLREYFKLR